MDVTWDLTPRKGEEPEIKLTISVGSLKKQEFQKNIDFCFIDYAKAFDCVDHNKLWKILKEMGPHPEVCHEGREPLLDKAGGSTFLP